MPSANRQLIRLRDRYVASLDDVEAASRRLTQALAEAATARTVVRKHLHRDGSGSDFEQIIEPGLRSSLSGALDAFERARHCAQRDFFRLMHAEGKSMTEIGETWGISRQLVSRMINESG